MLLTLSTTFGLAVWIVVWSLGAKGFDAFMVTAVVLMLAATVKLTLPNLPGHRAD